MKLKELIEKLKEIQDEDGQLDILVEACGCCSPTLRNVTVDYKTGFVVLSP